MVMVFGNGATSSLQNTDPSIADICERHRQELENLTFTTQPFKTLKFFVLAMIQYFKQSVIYLLARGGLLMLLSAVIAAVGVWVVTIDCPHEKYLEELSRYLHFRLWWIALGVASSIGLGSGLHSFVLYLAPHIALFTIKAMQSSRVDIKSSPYDTIQLGRDPSWLDKDCHEFGEPVFPSSRGLEVPLSSILPQVQLEAIIWGVGTAVGELPPYFISSAGSTLDAVEELDASAVEDNGFMAARLKSIKRWFLSHAQHLNFFTILVLAFVPNPLFDLAGIICGQFGIPFWKFFLSTLIGKAIIKTHIQTVFIISVCNNQLLNWIEHELISVLGLLPGLASVPPDLTTKLHTLREKYMAPVNFMPPNQVKNGNFSFAAIWNTVVWLTLLNFFLTIATSNAQRYLKKQQDEQLTALAKSRSPSTYYSD